jgi:hypothetical protein
MEDNMWEDNMCYGETLKPGDEALLDFGDDKDKHLSETHHLNGTIVIIKKRVGSGAYNGWYVVGCGLWFNVKYFRPAHSTTIATVSSSTGYCFCNLPDLKDSYAGGNKFLFCRICRKERL